VLKVIRRNASAAWVKVMFVAIVVVFVFWGIGSVVGGQKAQVVARINDQMIDPTEFYRTYNNLARMYADIYKDKLQPEMLQNLNLKSQAMDQLVRAELMRQEALRLGLRVSDAELEQSISTVPTFQQNGRFDKDVYLRTLRANNFTPGEFEEAQRDELLARKLQELVASGVQVSEAEVRDRYRFDNEKVDLNFIKLDAASFVPEVKLTDAEVQAYYDAHRDKFREPDRVRIESVEYTPDHFTDKVDVTDEAVQQYYTDHQTTYTKPEQVHARHILLKVPPDTAPELKEQVRKKAEDILKKVRAGEDFATLAQTYSEDSSAAQGGDLGTFPRGKMVPAFEAAAFALPPGATSEIVETPFGFHIIKVESKEEARTQPLDEVRAQVIATLKQEKARDVARAHANDAHTKAEGGAPLASIAQEDGLSVATPAAFSEAEGTASVGRPLASAALTVDPGALGPVVDTPQGFYVFRVVEKIAAHIPPLAEIRARVETAARTERAEALAKSKADALLPEVQKSGLDAVATAEKLTVQTTGPFTRAGSYIPNIGSVPELKNEAFKLTPEKPVAPAVYSAAGSSVLAALKERIPATDDAFGAQKEQLTKAAEDRRKQQVLEEFVNYLKAHAAVDISEDFLASVPDTGRPFEGGAPRRRR
jgi:peptidyl-prolyl cis-trans isomerase D